MREGTGVWLVCRPTLCISVARDESARQEWGPETYRGGWTVCFTLPGVQPQSTQAALRLVCTLAETRVTITLLRGAKNVWLEAFSACEISTSWEMHGE